MIKGLRIRNIRSLVDSGEIELKPITLLLGQNSSGKSSVLRTIPLLKQSIQTRSSAPILWYGDFVDFGSIRDVKSTLTDDDNVKLEFIASGITLHSYHHYSPSHTVLDDASITLSLYESEDATRVNGFTLRVGADTVDVTLDAKFAARRTTVNGIDYTKVLSTDRYRFSTSTIVPQLTYTGRAPRDGVFYYGGLQTNSPGFREISAIFQRNLHNRSSSGTISALVRRLEYTSAKGFLDSIRSIYSPLQSWRRYVNELSHRKRASELEEIRRLVLLSHLGVILHALLQSLSLTFNASAYIGPARATGERYYRHQELAVDQIDPQGRNLAMFLYSLSPVQREAFSTWLSESLGYALKVSRSGGHLQIELRENSSEEFHNITDMGYGFSQILPVLAQIWLWIRNSNQFNASSIIAIEQPELHLHPAYQSRIADVLCNAIVAQTSNNNARTPTFLVETHSESLINRLGELVFQKVIPPDSVSIYVFQRDSSSEATSITKSMFDASGGLKNWPLGFFTSVV